MDIISLEHYGEAIIWCSKWHGIYTTWYEEKAQVENYSCEKYAGFDELDLAINFMTVNGELGEEHISPVIKGLRFKKIKSKGFMVYSNALICLLFRKKSLPNFFLGNYLKCVDLVVARPDIFIWTIFSL